MIILLHNCHRPYVQRNCLQYSIVIRIVPHLINLYLSDKHKFASFRVNANKFIIPLNQTCNERYAQFTARS